MEKKTYYPSVEGNPDFAEMETEILSLWRDQGVFQASVEHRPAKNPDGSNNEFIFYDGPPFANGLPHYGHLLTGYVKDIVARYQTQKGKRVERRFGWDCHGLPAEMGAEKDLGISGRMQIMDYGIDKFNNQCRTSVMKFTKEWEDYVNRQGRWVDFQNDYKTMDITFMESVLWAFKELHKKGLVYESMRVMPYSWACETPLSNFETRLDNSYRERADKAVTVAFELNEKPAGAPEADVYKVLAWTTTPWTLPSNLALGVGEKIEYACVVVEKEYGTELPLPVGEGWGEGPKSDHYNKKLKEYARDLRKNATDVEGILWQLLRNRQLLGFKFYRQRAIGNYIADFVCRELELIIELDGGQHAERQQYDAKRTEFLEGVGYTVLRFWNNDVTGNLEGVMETIYSEMTLASEALTPTLSHRERGQTEPGAQTVCYILASSSVDKYRDALSLPKEKVYFDSIKGSDLVGLTYKPLFPFFQDHPNAFKIFSDEFIQEGDGTGIVHLAPGFGEDDQRVCEREGIKLVCPVDNAGKFTNEIYDLAFGNAEGFPPPEGGRGREGVITSSLTADTPTPTLPPQGGESRPNLTARARELRSNMTDAEQRLWYYLRRNQLESKFRRQHQIGRYITDFICLEKKLIIELDGGQHAENQKDIERTAFLEKEGYKVLRFWNNDVLQNIEGVLTVIAEALGISLGEVPQGESEGPVLSLQGRNVLETNDDIIKYLKAQGSWIKTEQILHNYPHCWRTDTPLIYKAVPSWYVEVTKFKDRMVELNQQINWVPNHIKDGLFGKWLENARDWSISRNRFWGTPIPVWRSDNPKNKELYVFGSIKELEEFFGKKVTDLHRPFIDELTKPDPLDPQYTIRRVEDVFDCWFESGSMPYGQAHYPFENKDWFENHFPADFIVEYTAQTRGWFYTLMVLSTALFDRPPFLNCICHGVVLDEKGQKLSKRLNNYADPKELFAKYGADALRWLMVSSPVLRGGELLIDKEGNMVRDALRLAIKPIWNAYNFFTLYANADGVKAEFRVDSSDLMDRYILAKAREAVHVITQAMDSYDTLSATQAVEAFFEVLNNWYIRRNRDRFWRSASGADANKQAAYDTLYTVLHVMCRAAAPLLPFVTEAIWSGLVGKGSIHLSDFPHSSNLPDAGGLTSDMDRVRDVCNAALAIRNTQNLRVRQPLAKLSILGSDVLKLEAYADVIKDEVNVKHIEVSEEIGNTATFKLQVNFPIVGKRLPAKMKDIIAASKQGKWSDAGEGNIEVAGEILLSGEYNILLEARDPKATNPLSTNDALVVLDLAVTEELKSEGIARDLIRLVQQSRKEADLNVSDRIVLKIETPSADIGEAANQFGKYIAEQTLAVSVLLDATSACKHVFTQELEGEKLVIGIDVAA